MLVREIIKYSLKKLHLLRASHKVLTYMSYLVLIVKVKMNSSIEPCSKNTLRCLDNKRSVNYKYHLLGKNTPVCCNTHLYEILRDVVNILNVEGIDYFIMYGTLLGHIRHSQTFIPWDTDVDIVILKNNENRVERVLKAQLSVVYDIVKLENILKVNFSKINSLHMDIYFMEEQGETLFDRFNDFWIKNRIQKKDVYPTVSSKIYDLDIKLPNNSIKVLKDTYGVDCLEVAFKKYSFKKEEIVSFNKGEISKKYLENFNE